jgi:tRNA A37 N6-isopentenylltransferase MiaA
MKNILTILLLVFLTGCTGTGYNDWTEKEQTKYKYFLALQTVDSLQTYKGLKCTSDKPLNECLEEANPVYGKSP